MVMVIAGLLLIVVIIVVMIMAGLLLIVVIIVLMIVAGLLLIKVMIIAGFPQTELLRLPSCMLMMFVAMVLLLLKVQPCLGFFHLMVMVMIMIFTSGLPSTSVLRMSMAEVATKTVAR